MSKFFWILIAVLHLTAAKAATPSLCGEGLDGSFVGKMDGKTEIRINLFCADENRMLGTLAQINGGVANSFILNLGQAEIDGSDLIVAPFTPKLEDFRGKSSANTFNYLRVNVADFRNGQLNGSFVGQTGNGFHSIKASKAQSFPKPTPAASAAGLNPRGVFVVAATPLGAIHLLFDIVHKVPIGVFTFGDGDAIHFTNGPAWDQNATFVLNNLGGDCGEGASKKLFRLSGAFISNDEVSLSWVSPVDGLQGPYRAIRVREKAGGPARN